MALPSRLASLRRASSSVRLSSDLRYASSLFPHARRGTLLHLSHSPSPSTRHLSPLRAASSAITPPGPHSSPWTNSAALIGSASSRGAAPPFGLARSLRLLSSLRVSSPLAARPLCPTPKPVAGSFRGMCLFKTGDANVAMGMKAAPRFKTKHSPRAMDPRIKGRAVAISMQDVGKMGLVHNGKSYVRVTPTTLFVGHKWGEFAPTRKIYYKNKKEDKRRRDTKN
ncbi:hypothetical protein AB1Y20_022107 [Prymnesium parvum]|uniref:30S ribosomal protein S19, chloroplastic n=1 Tax=Prymnesium parvum TaxID=97485 RepID=A0AB34JIJ7_PRYPA